MGKQFDVDEVSDLAVNPPDSILGEMADAARRAYCGIYQNNPGWVFAKSTFLAVGVVRTLDKFCADFTLPDIPTEPPFEGGQCAGARYNVFGYWGSSLQSAVHVISTSVFGPIDSIVVEAVPIFPGNPSSADLSEMTVQAYTQFGDANTYFNQAAPGIQLPGEPSIEVQVIPPDTDDCGNLPINLPPGVEPTDEELKDNIQITNINNETNNYTTVINRDGDNYVSFPAIVNVDNTAIAIDITGISIGEVSLDRPSGGDGGGDGGGNAQDTDSPPVPPVIEEEQEEEEGIEKEVENLVAIKVDVTVVPVNAQVWAYEGAPSVVFAGFVTFKKLGNWTPREHLDFEKSYFDAPEDAEGYAVAVREGYRVKVTEIKEKVTVINPEEQN